MRVCLLSMVFACVLPAQPVDVAGIVARVKAMSNPHLGASLLESAVGVCAKAVAPHPDCALAYDWYGILLQVNNAPENLSRAQPYYQRALELLEGGESEPGRRALALELEAGTLPATDPERSATMRAEATNLRKASVKAMQPPEVPGDSANTVYKVGGGVTAPSVEYHSDPSYSQEARMIKLSGTVRLSVVIDQAGRPRSITVVDGLGLGLDENAVESVLKWTFHPAMKDGNPVNVRARIEVNFRLL